jgi:hypothetical protein
MRAGNPSACGRAPFRSCQRAGIAGKLTKIQAQPLPLQAAASGIMGLSDEWEEIGRDHEPLVPYHVRPECRNLCYPTQELARGGQLRLFRRRELPACRHG